MRRFAVISLFIVALFSFSGAEEVGRSAKKGEMAVVNVDEMIAPRLKRRPESKTWARFITKNDAFPVVRVGENWVQIKNDKAPYEYGWVNKAKVDLVIGQPKTGGWKIGLAVLLAVTAALTAFLLIRSRKE
ncbi:MAG: hypothetical protein ACLFQK_09185 [Fibrobacterota bacterium]